MIFLFFLTFLHLHPLPEACPVTSAPRTPTDQRKQTIGNFEGLISVDSKLHSIIASVDSMMAVKDNPAIHGSEKKVVEKEENLAKPDGLKPLKTLLQVAKKHGQSIPEIGKYIKVVATVVDFVISDGRGEENGAIGKLDETIKQTRMEIMSELKDVKAVCAENDFDQISMQAGTLLTLLNDALVAIAGRRENENWWRPVMTFLDECSVTKPFTLVNYIGQIDRSRLPVNTRMEADFLKQNRTLEIARQRIESVLNILALVRTFELVLSKDNKTVEFEVNEMFKSVDRVLQKVEAEISNHIVTDSFKSRMPDLIEHSLKDSDHLNVKGKAERLMMALNSSATLDRFIVIVYEHKSGPSNILLNGPLRPCRITQMIDAVEENVYMDKNPEGCCGIVIYRSKKLRLMNPDERKSFRERHFNRHEGSQCPSKKASENRTAEVGFAVQTNCLNLAMIVDSRDSIEPTIGFTCYSRDHEQSPPRNSIEIPFFQFDYAYPL